MLQEIILQQKKEKEQTLLKDFIKREKITGFKKNLSSDLIKVITGPRRAGKSVFSFLLLEDANFAYLNFDDEKLLDVTDTDEIIKSLVEVYGKTKYIFFDEIQNLKNWELFVNKLQRRGYNLVLTGSNAKLLSKELSTSLTGRYISVEIFPFSFREFLTAKKVSVAKKEFNLPEIKGEILNYLSEYNLHGGFPEVTLKNFEPKQYLNTLYEAILLKDIVKRYNVRFTQKMYDLSVYTASNFCQELSYTKLKNILGFNSTHTAQNYLSYLSEAYISFTLNRYSNKVKEQINASKKIYLIDNGFIEAKAFQSSKNYGKLIENLIFIELLNRGCKLNMNLFYYKTRNQKEVDFVLKKGIKIKELIQVSYDVKDPYTEKREINSLLEASEELNCKNLSIITWDTEKKVTVKKTKISFIPLWKWLLDNTLFC
ncbi:MAG: hypothetical protein A3I68_02360 [Candidatus Melainabacteria bacterium RIFCSPLOWO2_02_FULL_35_15]|nr:MAG: hypothetical protein A3F80_00505 [Candidatus Melainabacteria bacterium RIFCSPLOWO2_12_FULL_35_11]OGI13250.1 MAG: hypothetical protein A3I68_02360 [Candidatus Melainabacteria bacterium RIFCSPLOWO2_02_FULL_35_15]